jgi:hypothetical protein
LKSPTPRNARRHFIGHHFQHHAATTGFLQEVRFIQQTQRAFGCLALHHAFKLQRRLRCVAQVSHDGRAAFHEYSDGAQRRFVAAFQLHTVRSGAH